MKLIFIRHGESIGNTKQGFISGQSDTQGLSEKGKIQIIKASWELRSMRTDKLYASPVVRAQETATILARYAGVPIKTLPWLSELHHGVFEGHFWWEVIPNIPTPWRSRREDFRTPYPQGESMRDVLKRTSQGLSEWLSKHAGMDGVFTFVAHQAVITCMRYYVEHGGFDAVQTSEQEAHFLKYLHEKKLDNGGFMIVTPHQNGASFEVKEMPPSESVKPSKQSVVFYAQGILSLSAPPDAERMETASTNAVYKLSTPQEYMLKVVKSDDAEMFRRQIMLYEYLHAQKIQAPHIISHDNTHAFFPYPVLLQDYIQGTELKQCLIQHPSEVRGLLTSIFHHLDTIHAIPVDEVKSFWFPPVSEEFLDWRTYMKCNIDKTLHVLKENERTSPFFPVLFDKLVSLKDYIHEGRYRMEPIHGDVGAGNIIVGHENGCKLLRIIDYEWARVGDGLWDFAYLWGWLERDNEEAASLWGDILRNHLPSQLDQIEWFRILFHAWTVRDMLEYPDHVIRLRRGAKSHKILERFLLP